MKLKIITLPIKAILLSTLVCATLATAKTSVQSANGAQQMTQDPSSQNFEHIVELLPEDFKPAFTRDTVIKLNAIVKRSYAVIREYDELTKALEKQKPSTSKTLSAEQLKALVQHKLTVTDSLEKRSKAALADMIQAAKLLKASDEHYNAAVLAGMMTFVKDVEREVSGVL